MTNADLSKPPMPELPTLDEQRATLEAQQNFLKIIPYILGFGVIGMIPISYLFIAPVFSDDIGFQIIATIGIVIAIGIFDFAFYKIFANMVFGRAQHLEQQSSESEQGPTEFAKILG
jgi:hypothetical protein